MISAIPPIPETMGVPRIIVGQAITSLLGDPHLPVEQERRLRRGMVLQALEALATNVQARSVAQRG